MKWKIIYSLSLCLSFLLWTCEEEEFYDIPAPAPSDLTVSYSIATDDSGELTLYPQAVGASRFHIFFGDVADESPTEIRTGERATHRYDEGSYAIRVIAFGLTNLTTEISEQVSIQFTPPENLAVDLQIDPVVTNKVTVTPTADNATLFEVFFGEVVDEMPASVLPGASSEYTYASEGTFEIKVIAKSASATTLEWTQSIEIVKPSVPLTLPIDFESTDVNYTFADFGNVMTEVVDNPAASGENTSTRVAQLFKPADAETWGGTFLQLPEPIDLSKGTKFQLKTWSPISDITIRLKIENESDPEIFHEVDAVNTQANVWENLTFDFSGADLGQSYHKVVVFFDFNVNGRANTFYFDGVEVIEDSNTGSNLALPLDFESSTATYDFNNFGNAVSSVVVNPDATGLNTSGSVGRLAKAAGAETWAGSFIELADPIDLGGATVIDVKTWSPKSGIVVKLKLENATNPDVAVEVDVTNTVANEWEQLSFDFTGLDLTADYHKVVLFFDFGNRGDDTNYYFDDVAINSGGVNETLKLPLDFESEVVSYNFVDFGNATASVIANPDPTGTNTTNSVGELVKANGAETWAGSFLELPEPIDLTGNKIFTMDIWSPKSGIIVKLKLENSADTNINLEVDATTTTENSWETLTFDFSAIDVSQTYQKVVIFFDFGNPGDGSTYYFDNISL